MNLKINSFSSYIKSRKNLITSCIFKQFAQSNKQPTQTKSIFKNLDKPKIIKTEIENSPSVKESSNKLKKNLPQATSKPSKTDHKKQKIITRREETVKINFADEQFMKNIDKEKIIEKENYASMYFRHKLENDFDLFSLRNLLFSYLFVKQRSGVLHLNICDTYYKASNEEKNNKVDELLKTFDWLDIKLDFNEKLQKKIFESQRKEDYEKWLKFLLGQRDAYICYCKNYMKCEGNCFHSTENINSNKDFASNPEVMYVRFKNQNSEYKLFDYMEREEVNFGSESYEDFLLYKNFNQQYTECYKRVIDDDIFNVTHIMEDKKSFNPYKNAILTKHLLFSEKKYIELPNIKTKYWNKEIFEKIDVGYLKSKFIVPEALLNEAFMLGHGKGPLKEYKELLINNKDKDIIDLGKILINFDLSNVTQMGATFDIRRLLYFNKRLLIKKFIKSHESFKPQLFEEFRGYFYKIFPKHVAKMKHWDHENWRKIIYLIIPEILTFEDLNNFYFLFERPIVSAISKENKKVIKTYFLDEEYKRYILKEIQGLFNKIKTFDALSVNREISYFIFRKYQQDKHLSNVNFFQLIKFIVSGFSDCPNVGEICEIIGKREVLNRVNRAFSLNKTTMVDNVRLLEEKKLNYLRLLSGQKIEEKLLENESNENEDDETENDKEALIENIKE